MQEQEWGFDHRTVERRWQERWEAAGVHRTPDDAEAPTYVLGMFPYPSGELHMGHVRNYAITDAYARYRRMQGDSVLHPMGWDAFGLPAENAAKERDSDPASWTGECIDRMREQFEAMGFGYDWDREVTTCEPDYYRWNQWLFRELREAGLVERRAAEVNWCPSCETVLADEQVEEPDVREGERSHDHEGVCWRCDTPVEIRDLDQWFLTITAYADELVEDVERLDGWPDSVRQMQRNWIGRQEGARVAFEVADHGPVEAFTTRLDTIFGATFFALAPDHPVSEALAEENEQVRRFIREEADPDGDEPKGIRTGLTATNPATGEDVPVFVADFVLSEVGTGALMGVPGHDERDHVFAETHDLPIECVVEPSERDQSDVERDAFTEDGALVNSGDYTGLSSAEARERLTADLDAAESATQYRLRDWLVSRQRYWGTPIPVVHCADCGPVLVPEDDLPVELPEFVNTTGNPLDAADEWKRTTCPECDRDAERETDTMDTFVDSSWYYLRYVSPDEDDRPFNVERANDWMPVDRYVGGNEHAVMHLLYARFVTKALADLGWLDHREPFDHLLAQGMVRLDGAAMSKSTGNVVSPERVVEEYGADTARLFTLEAASPDRPFDWTTEGVRSTRAFLDRLYRLVDEFDREAGSDRGTRASGEADPTAAYVAREIDATVANASVVYDDLAFDEALRETEGLVRTLRQYREFAAGSDGGVHAHTLKRGLRAVVRLLAPVAPHLCEELWADVAGGEGFVAEADWPEPRTDTGEVAERRRLVETTREDVREVVDVAGIDDPERIDVVVAPEWTYRVRERVRTTDADDVVGAVMRDEDLRAVGEPAADYAADLASERHALSRALSREREHEALTRAAWLVEREFDADVRVLYADEADDDVASRAEPGRPGIHVAE